MKFVAITGGPYLVNRARISSHPKQYSDKTLSCVAEGSQRVCDAISASIGTSNGATCALRRLGCVAPPGLQKGRLRRPFARSGCTRESEILRPARWGPQGRCYAGQCSLDSVVRSCRDDASQDQLPMAARHHRSDVARRPAAQGSIPSSCIFMKHSRFDMSVFSRASSEQPQIPAPRSPVERGHGSTEAPAVAALKRVDKGAKRNKPP